MVPDNCTKYQQNHHILLGDITTNTQNLLNSNNYSNLAQSQNSVLCASVAHGTQYEEKPPWRDDGLDPLLYSPILLRHYDTDGMELFVYSCGNDNTVVQFPQDSDC